ncbi:hypothetical protein C8F04DRAFT_1104641 [Mycena alexandri]|uniref:F-box domain-containing protein n=1 Tax=Mycena alexandri TaxID=1745969 RepID=A0AAD6STH7_9AGAR|nr:hypothetical protein C8F04DRAFT_1104641 [Mycena alexandri]
MPNLPRELEREIFELALRGDRRNTDLKLALCMVARRVQIWIDLIFYEMVMVRDDHHAGRFLSLVDSNIKPPAFFSAVKILCLPFYVSAPNAYRILTACTAVELLACWSNCVNHPEFSSLIGQLPLRRLSLELTHLSRVPATRGTWLSSLTHMYIIMWVDKDILGLLATIKRLPHLTHVALDCGIVDFSAEHAAVVCSSCPSIRVLVILILLESCEIEEEANDYRVVVQNILPRDPIADWEAPYFDLPDMWSRAEATIEERLKRASVGSV